MKQAKIILRKWSSRIRTADRQAYVRYVLDTGIRDYAKTPGNLGYHVLTRDLGEGATEITMLSWWESMDAIQAFAGPNAKAARYYPEDEQFLLERPCSVEHHVVEASRMEMVP